MANSTHRLSVIVPANPFTVDGTTGKHCLCAMDVAKLMDWWPGNPHIPAKRAEKVRAIQRSLDWKRVTQIAAYLLQKEIRDVPDRLNKYFGPIYEPKKNEPGRQWPPKITKVIGFQRSVFPTFSNVLIHVNGAKLEEITIAGKKEPNGATLVFDEIDPNLNFSVIDGQHRINGAFLAICILKETQPKIRWEIPADIFVDLDPLNSPPTKQAQIFIDVNFYQKKVDKSLVADLFPTARGKRDSLDWKERSQDIGRKLMLESGPLVGMIQIPGIKYGVKDVITLSTLNGAVENVLETMEKQGIVALEMQTEFLVQVLDGWSEATGKFKSVKKNLFDEEEQSDNIAYQGRILVSIITLVPALIAKLKAKRVVLISDKASDVISEALTNMAINAGLINNGIFISKEKFKEKNFLGSGGIGRFRNTLWAAFDSPTKISRFGDDKLSELAEENRAKIFKSLNK